MQYSLNRGEKGKVEIKVDVPKSGFEEAYGQVLAAFKEEANIAGFRPGKAPDEVVESHVGQSKILNKTASSLISQHLSAIFKKESLVPLDSPKIAVESLSRGAPFSFTVSFIQKPKVTVGDWKKIKVKKIAAREISEDDISQSIKNVFEAWKKQKGTIDNGQLTSDKNEEKNEGTEGKIATTEDTEGESEDTEGQPSFASTSAKATMDEKATEGKGKFIYGARGEKIFIKDEESKSKVESQSKIDDNFAKAIGARDLAHLRELVKRDLETLVADQVEVKLEEELFEKLAEIGDVEIPDILIDDELNRMIVRLNSELERQGKKIDEWLAEQKTTFVELRSKWREQAAKNVKITLIMDEIGKEEKVQVTREELEKSMANVNGAKLSEEQKHDLENYMVMSIFQAKTLDLVKKAVAEPVKT